MLKKRSKSFVSAWETTAVASVKPSSGVKLEFSCHTRLPSTVCIPRLRGRLLEIMFSHVRASRPPKGSLWLHVSPSMETQFLSGMPPWTPSGTVFTPMTERADGPSLAMILARLGVFPKPIFALTRRNRRPVKWVFNCFALLRCSLKRARMLLSPVMQPVWPT